MKNWKERGAWSAAHAHFHPYLRRRAGAVNFIRCLRFNFPVAKKFIRFIESGLHGLLKSFGASFNYTVRYWIISSCLVSVLKVCSIIWLIFIMLQLIANIVGTMYSELLRRDQSYIMFYGSNLRAFKFDCTSWIIHAQRSRCTTILLQWLQHNWKNIDYIRYCPLIAHNFSASHCRNKIYSKKYIFKYTTHLETVREKI